MRLKGLAALAAVALFFAAAVPVFAQSLADLAKREEERRRKIAEPAKVYTNKDLASGQAPSTPPASAPAAPAAAPSDAKDTEPAAKDKAPLRDQAYWAGRLKALRDELARNDTFAEAMQTRLNSLQTDFVNRDDPAQRSVIERNRQKVASELNRLKQSIIDGKKAIADLEEEARRAGVPPGWLR
jgi:predicted lipid-binding transport protein (Tim44 family)